MGAIGRILGLYFALLTNAATFPCIMQSDALRTEGQHRMSPYCAWHVPLTAMLGLRGKEVA